MGGGGEEGEEREQRTENREKRTGERIVSHNKFSIRGLWIRIFQ